MDRIRSPVVRGLHNHVGRRLCAHTIIIAYYRNKVNGIVRMPVQMINNIMFKPTYLYIKTHNQTKLKYFGKTTGNPATYRGSGLYWTNHIKKYGYDVTTEIFGHYTNKEQCLADALEFSTKHNIVESEEWANLRPESLDGGDTSQTDNYKKWLPTLKTYSKACKWWNNGISQTFKPTPPDNSYKRGRLRFNNVGAKLGSEIQKNKIWINNSFTEMMVSSDIVLPDTYVMGRLVNTAFAGGSGRHCALGSKWWNNGSTQVMTKECPGPTWIRGRLQGGGYGNRKS